jgi:hypothetical protein
MNNVFNVLTKICGGLLVAIFLTCVISACFGGLA